MMSDSLQIKEFGNNCSSNYIYVRFHIFVDFTQHTPCVYFFFGILLYIYPVREWLWHCDIIIYEFVLICLCISYNLFIGCTSSWVFIYIYPVYGLLYHYIYINPALVIMCLFLFYTCLKRYVCVLYTTYSLVVLHLGKLVVYIYWFVKQYRHPHCPAFTIVD